MYCNHQFRFKGKNIQCLKPLGHKGRHQNKEKKARRIFG